MSVLVTGGAGYIGGHMTLGLMDAGETVVVLDNLSTGFAWAVPDGAKFVVGDTGDADLVARLIAEHEVDAVAHFAAKIVVPESVIDPLDYYLTTRRMRAPLAAGGRGPVTTGHVRQSQEDQTPDALARSAAENPPMLCRNDRQRSRPADLPQSDHRGHCRPTRPAVGRRHHLCRDRGRLRLRRRDPRRLVAPRRRLCDQSLDRRQTDDRGSGIRNRATKAAAGLQASFQPRLSICSGALSPPADRPRPRRLAAIRMTTPRRRAS